MTAVGPSVSAALNHTERILFKRFDLAKWFVMGFCAFLASLGEGFNMNYRGGSGDMGSELSKTFPNALPWVQAHLPFVLTLGAVVLIFVIALMVLCLWLSSRGAFMLLDGIVHDRAAVKEPWHRFRALGNALFGFQIRVLAVLCTAGLILGFFGAAAFYYHPLSSIILIVGLVLIALVVLLAITLFFMVLHDFGVPIMYHRDLRPMEALRIFQQELLPGHRGTFIRFYLLKMVLALVGGILFVAAGCLTCCIGFMPYLSSVLGLPIKVFFRCYGLDLLGRLDPSLDLFAQPQAQSQSPDQEPEPPAPTSPEAL